MGNGKRSQKMTITIDCRMLDSSGVGVYLKRCLPFFLETANDFVLLGESTKLSPIAERFKNTVVLEYFKKPFSPEEYLFSPSSIKKIINQTDCYYSPYFNIPNGISIPVFTTIHDIIFPDVPGLVSPLGLKARMFFYRRAAKKSKKIFTVSEFSKSRIEYYLGKDTPVINASNAVTIPVTLPVTLPFSAGKKIKKNNTILFIGNIKKHKGLKTLLEAFLDAKKDGLKYHLIIAGNKNNFRSADTETAALLERLDPEAVEFTGFLPDEKLYSLLAEASLLVQPSLYEGFGYPPLEAMLCGTKALISDIPVFREIYSGFPVSFFKTGDSFDLKTKLLELLKDRKPEYIELTEELKNRYSFKKTVSKILLEMEE
jgi:glycosyltransferase involved in cell wall biosynthesis